ncbi:Phosphatidylserine decarboxylase [Pyrenophora tritici-repentis]|nr:Phosphatidylserine decarboxylase [Pyrenophora tritici-repentis]KAI1523395.1 phosphatidylserine decarboxylase family protein [Pyrenophora tritici-repentis]KAI1592981.1 phosphatidylserine decarboxylase family protein [Pyrenophora tritici-repentis]PZC88582.1 phosphatidylserine decarboxylase family protein [Pyrenophora tritici-repentis]
MVGTPFNAILDWPMGTPSGFAFFLDPDVNKMVKKVLNAWAEFLVSPDSAYVLGDDKIGWLSDHGIHDLPITANVGQKSYLFEELFECDPSKEHHGYKSWDHFFTRCFKEDKRLIANPEDDNVIANACESKPYKVARNVAQRDHFWIKGQAYSLMDMLAMDLLHEHLIGGTVYQAFLSALSTYFSEPLFEGLGDPSTKSDIDKGKEVTSQGYLTAKATRAIVFIEADNKDLGLVCFPGHKHD